MASDASNSLETAFRAMSARMAAAAGDMAATRDITEALQSEASEPHGVTYAEVDADGHRALWGRPEGAASGDVILYLHGGGYIANSPETVRKLAGHLGRASGAAVLVPTYRLAPEHRHPAQIEDAVAAFDWLLRRGFGPDRIALAGESAGGNLALATALWLLTRRGVRVGGVVGFSPWLDLVGDTETFDTNAAKDGFLSREASRMMARMYVGDLAAVEDPLVNPAAADPAGMPPMYLSAGGSENLLSAVRGYAERAAAAGVDVRLDVSPGMQHAYPYMAGRAPEADATVAAAGEWLRARFDEARRSSDDVKPTIVLTHGAWTDSGIWSRVAERLAAHGYPLRFPQLPLRGFQEDVGALSALLDQIPGPVVLVGWSYSGAVVTAAGDRPNVLALAYICAVAPGANETIGTLLSRHSTSVPLNLVPDGDGFFWLDERFAREGLGSGLPDAELRHLVATQKPMHSSFVEASVARPAWQGRPSTYLVTAMDQALASETQREMAVAIGAEVSEAATGHLVLLSDPDAVAATILSAVELARRSSSVPRRQPAEES